MINSGTYFELDNGCLEPSHSHSVFKLLSLIVLLRCLTKPFAIATVSHVTSPLDLLHSAVLAFVHVDIAQARYYFKRFNKIMYAI